MNELTLDQIINSNVKCSNLTKKLKKEIDDSIDQLGLNASELILGAKLFILRNKLTEIPKCKACQKELKFHTPSCSYRTYCSTKCSLNTKETIDKRRATNMNRYGSINVLTSKDVIEKTKRNMLETHGVEHYVESQEYKQRCSSGNIVIQRNPILQKQRRLEWSYNNTLQAFKDKVIPLFSLEEFYGGGPGKYYPWKCMRCEASFTNYYNRQKGTWPKCPHCDSAYTDIEYFVINFLTKQKIPHNLRDRKTIPNRELDIHIEQCKVAIETNGLYFHSEKKISDSFYHIKKTDMCTERGIKLIQIFADEIYYKKQLCLAKIKNILNINKKLELSQLSLQYINDCSAFLNKYTFEGEVLSDTKLGIFYKNRLIGVITFKNQQIVQFAFINLFDLNPILPDLCKTYMNDFNLKRLVYNVDIRWNPDQNLVGFEFLQRLNPSIWYTKDYLKRTRDFHENYERLWDCGHNQFLITNE